MSFARGERFELNLDSDDEEQDAPQGNHEAAAQPPPIYDFVGDIKERVSTTAKPPTAPTIRSSKNGFPTHKKRDRVSAFRQQRATNATANNQTAPAASRNSEVLRRDGELTREETERERIDRENNQRLAEMSPEEIEQEQKELFEGLSPALIQRLLGRATIDDGRNENAFDSVLPSTDPPRSPPKPKAEPSNRKVTFDSSVSDIPPPTEPAAPPSPQLQPTTEPTPAPPSIHFPQSPHPPDLDPTSSTFLTDLHDHYFPSLPHDPSRLAWLTPLDPADTSSPYHPSQSALNPSDLRFGFNGALIPPRMAAAIPTTKGLHHHGDAPEAAGYTIPELARLARSKVAAQRCVAFQTLGRVLYRLGKGEFGVEEGVVTVDGPVRVARDPGLAGDDEEDEGGEGDRAESVGSAMCRGLWECVEEGRVVETLVDESEREGGHLTAKTYAQEALWNWRRGGGRKRKAV
ncbi:uncharacterized protein BDZ99DRAFT_437156 [Mytilinidion resinicola]|uniref:Transcription factor Rba50 n=1 Tax=Mytilinidion resinicola TaxID=574789 RepID=A0A6A6YZB3_9PEZI|nr:uncharacterized protein BDZ99DRAFT_437156 [Mytilinidion resinicola]KAF2814276.1 hypothetical protein BDZ99DRAFT_437156 [Mytilinidion resinicola]